MKMKFLGGVLLLSAGLVLASCGNTSSSSSSLPESTSSSSSSSSSSVSTSSSSSSVSSVETLSKTEIFVVGDSTLCSFNDTTYYYPRAGYATKLNDYLKEEATVVNLALSGRSSKSFLQESNYQTLKDSIGEGDYLLIGFGHNDEKGDDTARFTDANKPTDDETSFKYHLYNYYVKLAVEKGATPILCSPIVRLSNKNDYSGNNGHNTNYGDYGKAVVELAKEKEVNYIDMTSITKEHYEQETYDIAKYYHAVTAGKLAEDNQTVVADFASLDSTHLNDYGAKVVSYLFAKNLLETDYSLSKYVDKEKLVMPDSSTELKANPNYVYSGYSAVDWNAYTPTEQFTMISEGWHGTGFGDTGGDPNSASNGYVAKETEKGKFLVGQYKEGSNKGKFASSSEGFAFAFQQVSANKNFTLTAKAKVITTANTKQAGFGLMLRDDCYEPNKNSAIIGNYVAAGFLCDNSSMTPIFSRSSASKLTKSSNSINALYAVDDEATLTITRLGQKVTVTVEYKGTTYTEEYLDFPLQTKDSEYMYIGMFANRGTTVEFSDVVFEITGDAIVA
ncbi:MAG: hypothetical protein IJV94_01235 [Bacilli bacterium]|nr:hypothetical protein [Bacilli bacterium]